MAQERKRAVYHGDGEELNMAETDLISRQAAIGAVEHITSSMSVCVNSDECHGMKRMQRQTVIELTNLPPAQPEERTGKRTETHACDLISRQAAIEYLMTNMNWYDEDGYESDDDYKRECITELINGVPSAQPCEDAISREYLVEHIKACWTNSRPMYSPDLSELLSWIDDVPLAQPKPIECEDAISRADAVRVASGYCHPQNIANELAKLPSVNPQPKTGRWVQISPQGIYECSECGQNVMTSDICAYKFCHGCGAKMVEPQENEVTE